VAHESGRLVNVGVKSNRRHGRRDAWGHYRSFSNYDVPCPPRDFCTALNGTGSALYCRFTIKGNKKNVRASITVQNDGHLHVVLPAQ
jgi:hypothetical protein